MPYMWVKDKNYIAYFVELPEKKIDAWSVCGRKLQMSYLKSEEFIHIMKGMCYMYKIRSGAFSRMQGCLL